MLPLKFSKAYLAETELRNILNALIEVEARANGVGVPYPEDGICLNVEILIPGMPTYSWRYLFEEFLCSNCSRCGYKGVFPFAEIDKLNGYNLWEGKSLEIRLECLDWLIKRFREELKGRLC